MAEQNAVLSENLVIVNYKFAAADEQPSDLVYAVGSKVKLRREAAEQLERLIDDIGGREEIVLVSGFRSAAEQREIWENSIAENGLLFTEKYVAMPAHSEHHTGLAIDLGKRRENIDFIRPEFPYSGVCGEFRRKAAEYGFILRYPKGKEYITKIAYEPWHFRYVGTPHAEIIERGGLVLEEYAELSNRLNKAGNLR